ncbi:2-oxoacid:acceptor oxidoreductase family protein [Aminivibrio sp.]|jgi:2-oxoglutarate ferredoxin oxidoreductase subunit gamma|uniref:2-oxoacid:acceptor oxidoreductase family protein n=1 Tax=Aminivibrio sp. TaxID=1872489 RepID=UPI001A3BBB01|nr:2-oxoacid:acceptor oxidoreductase family protein [Aminivibrio sp.]MBL3538130.1 2-oxoacid:acceptor oxidoreductase family protein [Aminivibrio sp.]MDK2958523.1 2-oxoglutarate ferredoxin oxidoreductase subunit gamma [Synergistaceae bacterium]
MNGRTEIVLSGVGGQGLVTIGGILGEAAVLEGRNACLSSSYGTEARGTFTKSDVIISDDEIDFIEAEEPGTVLCLAQAAYDRYSPVLGPEAVLVYDSDTVTPSGKGAAREKGYSISSLAEPGMANLAALGLVVALSGAVREESAASVLRKKTVSSSPLRKGSEEAFRKGFAAASL